MAHSYSYRRRLLPGHPLAGKDGLVYVHRLVASQKLGRVLRPDEHVHHINGDTRDNRPENITVCSLSEHTHLHHGYAATICGDCGADGKTVGRGLCAQCYGRRYYQANRAESPPRSCPECGESLGKHARLCERCRGQRAYQPVRQDRRSIPHHNEPQAGLTCSACGERPAVSSGKCTRCYHRDWVAARLASGGTADAATTPTGGETDDTIRDGGR